MIESDASSTQTGAAPGAAGPLLEVRGLEVTYGSVKAVDGVSLAVPAGGAVALLGANGAGKSSILRTIAALQRPAAGEITFSGTRINRVGTADLVHRGLAIVPDSKDLFPRFTVAENLRMGAYSRRGRDFDRKRNEIVELFPALERRMKSSAWQLSGGEQQMLALARALLSQPRLLILDEPSLGLAPMMVQSIFEALARIVAEGTAILLAEQSTAAALRLAGYGYVLRTGRVELEGPATDLARDPHVLDLYLGAQAGEGAGKRNMPEQ
jgi:branched-chain amino acid transport system ATP-binding protein